MRYRGRSPRSVYAFAHVQLACTNMGIRSRVFFPLLAYERKMSEAIFLHKTLDKRFKKLVYLV